MPNIRESLYQCLANEITVPANPVESANPMTLELCQIESSCNAYSLTIYVVYNGTSFLEINLNSGVITRTDEQNNKHYIGYYMIRQAALQENEQNTLFLKGKTYFLRFNNLPVNSKVYIRKELKFGTYQKLLSSVNNTEELLDTHILTNIKYDTYRTNTAYSNGYFVETQDSTYVRHLLPKGVEAGDHTLLGTSNNPFDNAYITDVTTNRIIISGENSKLGQEADQNGQNANHISSISADTVYADQINMRANGVIDLSYIKVGINDISIDPDNGKPAYSGFRNDGSFEIRYASAEQIYTAYVEEDEPEDPNNPRLLQKLVVPGGIELSSGGGTFTRADINKNLYLGYLDMTADAVINDPNRTFINGAILYTHNGNIKAHTPTVSVANTVGTDLHFVTDISLTNGGKDIEYNKKTVTISNTYKNGDNDTAEDKKQPISSLGVTDAITTLATTIKDGAKSSFDSYRTLSGLSVGIDGKLNASFQDVVIPNTKTGNIKIKENQSNEAYPYTPKADVYSEYTLTDALNQRARLKHGHGNIDNEGIIEGNAISIATNDCILIGDVSDSYRLVKSVITFDTTASEAAKFLNKGGSWKALTLNMIDAGGGADATIASGDKLLIGDSTTDNGTTTYTLAKTSIAFDTTATTEFLSHAGTWSALSLSMIDGGSDATIADGDTLLIGDKDGNNYTLKRSSISFDGSTATNYLSQKGTWVAAPTISSLGTDDRYVRYDAAQTIADASQARANIGAGTVNKVEAEDGAGITAAGATSITDTGKLKFNLTAIHDANSSTIGTSSNIAETTVGEGVAVPYVTYDKYGRVTGGGTKTAKFSGHTAEYSIDNNGVLTITVI